MLSLLGILYLDWNFWPFLGILGFSEKYENVLNELFQFILEITFGCIFNMCHLIALWFYAAAAPP